MSKQIIPGFDIFKDFERTKMEEQERLAELGRAVELAFEKGYEVAKIYQTSYGMKTNYTEVNRIADNSGSLLQWAKEQEEKK